MLTDYLKKFLRAVQDLGRNSSALDQGVGALSEQYDKEQNKKTKLILILSALGIVLFLGAAIFLPFKDKLFNLLYPKRSSEAAFCDGKSLIPAEKQGFVYTGGDLSQEIQALNASLYYTYDASLDSNKHVYMVGKYAANYIDPLGLHLLMGDNLSNVEFRGLPGQNPAGWTLQTVGGSGSADIETLKDNTLISRTSAKIVNHKSPSGTQLAQAFKESVKEKDLVVFGTWVKTQTPDAVKFFLQGDKAPFVEFGQIVTPIKAQKWNFILGYGKVPAGVTNFQLVLRVAGQESTAWFSSPVAAIINAKSNATLTKLVSERCGSAWFIDNEPGVDFTTDPYVMEPITAEIYALLYNQFYQAIKEIDPAAVVLPAGLAEAPNGGFLDRWRTAYKGFFGTEPPLDALNIHYLATDSSRWSDATNLESYLGEFHAYMDGIVEWKGKSVWISELGVSSGAPNGGVNFAKAAIKFLTSNNLNIEKWFWFDTCAFKPNLTSLFQSANKICAWPAKLTSLGEAYYVLKPTPTPTPLSTPVVSSAPSVQLSTATSSAQPTVVPTLAPVATPVQTATSSAQNQASSSGDINQ